MRVSADVHVRQVRRGVLDSDLFGSATSSHPRFISELGDLHNPLLLEPNFYACDNLWRTQGLSMCNVRLQPTRNAVQ